MDDPRIIPALVMSQVPLGTFEMNSTFQIKTSAGTGTAFLHHSEAGRFFVTAAHLLSAVGENEKVFLAHESGWIEQIVRKIFRSPEGHDVAAFVTEMQVGGIKPLT